MAESLYDDEYELEDDEIEDRIASLEYQLGISDGEPSGYQPDDNELALLSQRITDLEQKAGVDLDDDDFQRVGELAQQYGDPQTAFNLVVAESNKAVEEWDREFEAGVEKLEAEIGRTLTKVERDKLIDHHDAVSDPDAAGAWKALYGNSYSDEQVDAVEAKHQAQTAELREDGYSQEFVAKYDEENREKVTNRVAELRRSGKGEYDLDTEEGRSDYMQARMESDEQQTVKPLSDDARPAERRDYINARFDGATVEEGFDPETASDSEVEDHIDKALQ